MTTPSPAPARPALLRVLAGETLKRPPVWLISCFAATFSAFIFRVLAVWNRDEGGAAWFGRRALKCFR